MVLESRIQTGRKGEDWAIQALSSPSRQLGHELAMARHEIDAVFMELDTVVFLEVKTRTGCGTNLTGNLPMPDTQQQRIIRAAHAFMKRHRLPIQNVPLRRPPCASTATAEQSPTYPRARCV